MSRAIASRGRVMRWGVDLAETPREVIETARILVVDDDPAQRASVLALMRDAGHDARAADSAEDALALARRVRPDLVLLDTGILGTAAGEFCRRLKSDPDLDHAFVVELGALDSPDGRELDADAHLARTLPRRELLARVEAMLRVQRAESALRRLKRRQATRIEIAHILSSSRSVDEAGPLLLRALGQGTGWQAGELWTVKTGIDRLYRRSWWVDGASGCESFMHDPAEPFTAAGEDLPGHAWASGQFAWIPDVLTHTGFARAEGARRAGLRGAAVLPVQRPRGIDAVLVLFSHASPPQDHDLVLMLRDIAVQFGHFLDRVEAETESRFQRNLFRAMIESIPDGVTLKDLDNRYVMVNTTVERMLALTASEIIGRRDDELLPADLVERLRRQEEEAIRLGVSQSGEYTLGEGDQARQFLILKNACRDTEGRLIGTIGVSHDITEHRHAEERMRMAQRVEALGRLAGGVAHDFNNLLTVITVNSDMALADLEAEHPQARAFVEIRDAAERASELTRQLLAYGRRQHIHPRTLDLNALVSNLHSLLRRLIPENIVVGTHLGTGVDPVTVDATQMEQVIINLAVNARDAMPHGGHLSIETRGLVVADGAPPQGLPIPAGRYAALLVSDDGIGMDESTRLRIFEPYFTTKALGQGTGLGLAMVYGTVKQSGGWIWADSAPGAGTTFTICLPATGDAAHPVRESAEGRSLPGGRETILLVEDDAVVRDISRRVLESCGYRLLVARDGAHAIELVRGFAEPVDLMVSDVVMPRMSGPVLHERLLATRPGLCVLYVSGYADQAVLPAAVLDGGIPFLQKPFRPEELARLVRATLDAAVGPRG
jgi:PAS domain S-box-containing protein